MYEPRDHENVEEVQKLEDSKKSEKLSSDSKNLRSSTERKGTNFDFAAARERLSKKIPMLSRQWVQE